MMKQFVSTALERLSGSWNPDPPDPRDIEAAWRCAETCFMEGFSLDDAVAYLRNLEHVDETVPEDIALRRMATIRAKYVGVK